MTPPIVGAGSAGATTVSTYGCVAGTWFTSVTPTVKLDAPSPVGVPASLPVASSVTPAGNAPLTSENP